MQISELQARQGKVEVAGKIIEKSEPREFEKFGKQGKVANAKLQDTSGVITLTLWNEQVDQFQVGDNVKVSNGFVNEWQGEMQLTAGKFGTLEKIDGDLPEPAPKSAQELLEASKKEATPTTTDQGEKVLSDDEKTESNTMAGDLGEPDVQDSVTKDEKVEMDVVAKEKKPSLEESETVDEIIEEDISVEEEDIE